MEAGTTQQQQQKKKKWKRLPIDMYIILEHASPIIYTSNVLQSNHFVTLLDNIYFKSAVQIFKNEFQLSKSTLLENSAVDTLSYEKHTNDFEIFFKNSRILIFYIFYFYKIKTKITLITYNTTNSVDSVDLVYRNANWLERETAEMFNIFYKNKRDCRKLLLDYTIDVNPMLKNYPVEGEYDCYYSHIENQVILEKYNPIEL